MSEPKKVDRAKEAREKIARFHASLGKRDYFQLFGADRETDPERLKAAYHLLAKQWHADAYAGLELGEERDKLDEIFKIISEAYETITDKKRREEYLVLIDRKARGMVTDVNQVLEAERLFDEALLKIRRKDWSGAQSQLEQAAKLNPDDNLLATQLAWARYNTNPKSKDNVNASLEALKAVVKRQDNVELAYQYGGQICFAQDRLAEARKWWKKCLEYEPGNVDATRGLRLISQREAKPQSGVTAFFQKIDELFKKKK